MSPETLAAILAMACVVSGSPISPTTSSEPSFNNPSNCKDITIPVIATATNFLLPAYPNSTAAGTVYKYIAEISSVTKPPNVVSGTFNISGTYCTPTRKLKDREGTIQVLLHGLALDKSYWSGSGFPNPDFSGEYSWVSHANSQGYSTLAIDNLGTGGSSHPDPVNVVQTPLQVQIMREIVQSLRNGQVDAIPKSHEKVIFVSHSYGSIIARLLATVHSTDAADAYVFTATARNLTGITNTIQIFRAQAASVVHPQTLAELPPGYVSPLKDTLRETLFSFNHEFDPEFLEWERELPHAFAVGEVALTKPSEVSNFTGPVMVLTGRTDAIACGTGSFNGTGPAPDCGIGKNSNPDMIRMLFPNASRFDSYIPDKAGHNLNSHYSAPESFGVAHQWLQSVGF